MTETELIKNLSEVSDQEKLDFLNSFDRVLCDVDGVLWLSHKIFPGSIECISSLRKLKKRIVFVSNNSTLSLKLWQKKLEVFGAEEGDVITPSRSIMWYLKKIQMEKEIYVISTSSFKKELEDAGFRVANDGMEDKFIGSITELAAAVSSYSNPESIGAVVMEYDINVTFVKLQKAVKYLLNDNVVFLSGATDKLIPFTKEYGLIGPGYFTEAVEDIVGRQSICLSKPSAGLKEMILKEENIQMPERVLFIGDSIPQDMSFATDCGFQKLLVMSGITKKEEVLNWTHAEELKPTYFIESLESFKNVIYQVCQCSANDKRSNL